MNPVVHLVGVLRERGPRDVPRILARGLWGSVNTVCVACRLDQPRSGQQRLGGARGLTLRPMTPDDAESVGPLLPEELMHCAPPRRTAWVRRHFAAGGGGYLALDGARPLGGLFTQPVGAGHVGVNLLGPHAVPPVVRIIKSFVVPASRGRGVGALVYAYALRSLAERGVKTLVSEIEEDNVPSLKVNQRVGFRLVGVVRTKWRFGIAFARTHAMTPICRELGFTSYFDT